MIGTRLGPYEITAKLGEGGMGEVFRARNTELDREVAVKVLPPHLAAAHARGIAHRDLERDGGDADLFLQQIDGAKEAALSLLDDPAIAPGVLFWPIAWSPDGSLVAGSAVRAGQIGEIHIWSIADRAYRELPRRRGEQVDYSVVFVDRDRLVFGSGTGLSLGDLRGGELKPLYTPPPGHLIVNLSGSSDGRSLTWIDKADESDIWLMTLDEKTTP